MAKEKHQSLTPATQWLKAHKIPFEEKSYEYVEHGGTALAAIKLIEQMGGEVVAVRFAIELKSELNGAAALEGYDVKASIVY